MKLLVTGGAGDISSIVGSQLLGAGRDAVQDVVGEGFDGVLHFAALALVGESVARAHPRGYSAS
jgi:UDP-glucose 4-epimerase